MIRKGLPWAIIVVCTLSHAMAGDMPRSSSATKAGELPLSRLVDDFNLPLVITMVAPEVPPEIRGPTQPAPVQKKNELRSIPKKIPQKILRR